MKVIKYGHIKPRTAFCRGCGAELEFTVADAHFFRKVLGTNCPVCRRFIPESQWDEKVVGTPELDQCGNEFGVIVDKLTLKQAGDAIEQLVKECDDEREAADEWQHRYFELTRKCFQLEQERDAYAKCFRITSYHDPLGSLPSHAIIRVDWNDLLGGAKQSDIFRCIVYRMTDLIDKQRRESAAGGRGDAE